MVVAHAAGLLRAAGGVGLGIEVQHYTLAAEVSQLDSAAVLVGELEVGGLISGFDHSVNTTGARRMPRLRGMRYGAPWARRLERVVHPASVSRAPERPRAGHAY